MYNEMLFSASAQCRPSLLCAFVAKEIRLKHGAPVIATFIVDRNLRPLSETAIIKGGSDAESPAATGGHRLVVCTQQQIKVVYMFIMHPYTLILLVLGVITGYQICKNPVTAVPEVYPWAYGLTPLN